MYVCVCFAKTDSDIKECVDDGYVSLEDVCEKTGAGNKCGLCIQHISDIIKEKLTDADKDNGV